LLSAISLIYWFGNQGVLKEFLSALGVAQIYGPVGVVIAECFAVFPHAVMILVTALALADARLYEAADALGLDYWQAQRLIVMPQALKVSIPGIVSTFIGLFKDTTLVAFVGLMDPLKGVTTIVRADTAWKGIYWEPYIFVGAIFFAVCFGMSRYSMYLEQKLKTDHR
jgi:general L-amino acid transport system permease protein